MAVLIARGAPRFDRLVQHVTFRRLFAVLVKEERGRRDLVKSPTSGHCAVREPEREECVNLQ